MRKLATLREVASIHPIEDADQIVLAKIDGWQCVVKKGEFNPGQMIVFIEVDAWVPHEIAPFLSKGKEPREFNGIKGERLRSIKLRGNLSQGLALPLTVCGYQGYANPQLGDDVSDLIGVTKWEPMLPACLAGQAKGTFPSFIPKTDQERIQNIPNILADKTTQWEVTQKLDGSSMTVFWNNGEFGVCSRNLELKEADGNTFLEVAKRLNLNSKLEQLNQNIALQGELIGPGIQGNSHGLVQHDMFVFDVFFIDEQRYATPYERKAIMSKSLFSDIRSVPEICIMNLMAIAGVDEILKYAESITDLINPNNKTPEGIVFKSMTSDESFKVISNKYLLKEK